VAHTGAELADELHISHDTVRTHSAERHDAARRRLARHLVAKALGDGPLLA
jgi:hypothetical protein